MFKNKFKKFISKKSTGIIITVLTFVGVFCAIFANSNLTIAADSLPGIVEIRNEITDGNTPYRVLEIVPSRDVAQFGFMVGGQEPLDATELYNSTTGKWMSWQEYLTLHSEDKSPAERKAFMASLAANNAQYVSMGAYSADKPMWYVDYQEVDASYTGDKKVISGGNTPVYGWLEANDVAPSERGWNAKFTKTDDGMTLAEYAKAEKPYYIVETETAIDADDLTKNNVYPEKWYVYKFDEDAQNGGYLPHATVAQFKKEYQANFLDLSKYKILKFKLFTEGDITYVDTNKKYIYEASNFEYLREDSADKVPYILEPWITGPKKGHHLEKPSVDIYYTGGFYTNEWFKQYSLDIDTDQVNNYNVEVVTMTAGELNTENLSVGMSREELVSFLATIDFIYINPGNGGSKYIHNNSDFDLNYDAVELIFEKVCNEKTPCIVDYSLRQQGILDSNFSDTKVHALAVMLMQNDYRLLLTGGQFTKPLTNVATWVGSIVATNNHNYVNDNVMVINSTLSGYDLLDNYHTTSYDSNIVNLAYSAVLDEIELENMYRLSDPTSGFKALGTDIYKSTVVRYIMHFTSERQVKKKTSVHVLEIQPAKAQYSETDDTDNSNNELRPTNIRTWMGVDETVEIKITTMTTTEFIGTIDDLNSEYDFIYIGADINGMQSKSGNTAPYWNDGNIPNGMIYTNIGDKKRIKTQLGGHLATDFIEEDGVTYIKDGLEKNGVNRKMYARFSGNDITPDKFNKLVDYMRGKYPIVVSGTLCSDNKTPNSAKIDNCTYLYSFLEQHLDEDNVFTVSEISSGKNQKFKFYSNKAKMSIGTKVVASEESTVTTGTAFVQPGVKDSTDQTSGQVTYIDKENGKYYMRYKFTITNDGAVYGNTKYSAALYIDSNADGKFSEEYEIIPDIKLTHVASGNAVANGQLVEGEQYLLTRQLPDTYSDFVTWKVEVSQNPANGATKSYVRDSVRGYTKLRDPARDVRTIKVLQIYRDGGNPLVLETAIGNAKRADDYNYNGYEPYEILHKLVWGGTLDGKYYDGITDEYKFNFTSYNHTDFNNAYKNGSLDLLNYDMIILGFYDSYNLTDNSSHQDICEEAIVGKTGKIGLRDYIDRGKSVLFAHDTTSFTPIENYKSYKIYDTDNYAYTGTNSDGDGMTCSVWAYYLNKNIRNMIGMDCYGISLGDQGTIDYSPLKTGKSLESSDEGKELMKDLERKMDAKGYYPIGKKQIAYKPGSRVTNSDGSYSYNTVPEVQAFCYTWMELFSVTNTKYRANTYTYNSYKADRVNEGQITTYPYYLDSQISIARTHSQYFTLDLNTDDDKDNETDLVVWYTMGGSGFSDLSPKDVLNNYYIYNKGNITYTGFGDINEESVLKEGCTVEEGKLFINTMIAAYKAGKSDPEATIYESEDSNRATNVFYEYGDADNEIAFRNNTFRMYFSINDLNVLRGTKTATTSYYVKLKDGVSVSGSTYTTGGVTYPVVKIKDSEGVEAKYLELTNLKTYAKTDRNAQYPLDNKKLECGVTYFVDIPADVFKITGVKGQNVNVFALGAQTILEKVGSITGKVTKESTAMTYETVEFVHVELFPLD